MLAANAFGPHGWLDASRAKHVGETLRQNPSFEKRKPVGCTNLEVNGKQGKTLVPASLRVSTLLSSRNRSAF